MPFHLNNLYNTKIDMTFQTVDDMIDYLYSKKLNHVDDITMCNDSTLLLLTPNENIFVETWCDQKIPIHLSNNCDHSSDTYERIKPSELTQEQFKRFIVYMMYLCEEYCNPYFEFGEMDDATDAEMDRQCLKIIGGHTVQNLGKGGNIIPVNFEMDNYPY